MSLSSNKKYPVRISLFVTEKMDDQLDEYSEIMQITKHEFIRYVLGQALLGYEKSVDMMREKVYEDGEL